MSVFVLIPGAWLGAWSWDPVIAELRSRGHTAHAVPLTGLDDETADASEIHLETHVDDVLELIAGNDLKDVTVVGHGTSGVLAAIATDRCARIVRTVYVEGFLAHHGRSVLDAFPPSLRDEEIRLIEENRGRWPVPDPAVLADGQDLTPDQAAVLARRMVAHPGRPLTEPVSLKQRPPFDRPSTYVVCSHEHFGGRLSDEIAALRTAPGWTFRTLDTGIWPMLTAPAALAELLAAS